MTALPRDASAEMLARCWDLLEQAASDRRAAMHLVHVATVGLDGAPQVRAVVLRGVDRAAGTVRFHTDARSAKVAEILAEPRVTVHGYDPEARVQLRLHGVATLHADDALADASWAESANASRVCYRGAHGPGTPLEAPEAADPGEAERRPADPDAGREHFRAVLVTVERFEWLHLAHGGHRRAVHVRETGWQGRWLAP